MTGGPHLRLPSHINHYRGKGPHLIEMPDAADKHKPVLLLVEKGRFRIRFRDHLAEPVPNDEVVANLTDGTGTLFMHEDGKGGPQWLTVEPAALAITVWGQFNKDVLTAVWEA